MPKFRVARTAAHRVVPGMLLVEVGRATRDHWHGQLTKSQRRQAIDLLKQSHGRPGNLTARQRKQAKALAQSFDVRAYARLVATTAAGTKARQRSR